MDPVVLLSTRPIRSLHIIYRARNHIDKFLLSICRCKAEQNQLRWGRRLGSPVKIRFLT